MVIFPPYPNFISNRTPGLHRRRHNLRLNYLPYQDFPSYLLSPPLLGPHPRHPLYLLRLPPRHHPIYSAPQCLHRTCTAVRRPRSPHTSYLQKPHRGYDEHHIWMFFCGDGLLHPCYSCVSCAHAADADEEEDRCSGGFPGGWRGVWDEYLSCGCGGAGVQEYRCFVYGGTGFAFQVRVCDFDWLTSLTPLSSTPCCPLLHFY